MISVTLQTKDEGQIYIHDLTRKDFNTMSSCFDFEPTLNTRDESGGVYLSGNFKIDKLEFSVFSIDF
jgi:hypothetical protein